MFLFRLANNRYSARQILAWLWRAWRGNRTQAVLNALIGLLGVGVSLASVWAVQHAIDVASGTLSGSIAWSVTLMSRDGMSLVEAELLTGRTHGPPHSHP